MESASIDVIGGSLWTTGSESYEDRWLTLTFVNNLARNPGS